MVGGSSPSTRATTTHQACERLLPMKEKIINFFDDVYKEMGKVTWPTQTELRESTVVVLVVCLLISAFVYLVDTVVSKALQGIF